MNAMSNLVRENIENVIFMLDKPPFNYIVGSFCLCIAIYSIFFILKGGEL